MLDVAHKLAGAVAAQWGDAEAGKNTCFDLAVAQQLREDGEW